MAQNKKTRLNFDYVLLTVVLFLLGFGLLMIYSASSYEASITFGEAEHYLKGQARAIVVGLIVMAAVTFFPYEKYRSIALFSWIVSMGMVLLVKTSLGHTSHGATRWLRIGPLTVQPAEIVKVTIIILEATLATKLGKNLRSIKGLAVYFAAPIASALLVLKFTKNLSSAIIILVIAVGILFVSVPDIKWFIISAVVLGGAAVAGLYIVLTFNVFTDYRIERIKAWLDPYSYSDDKAYQTLQALYAIGSGGIWGKGLGQSMQKRVFLPEAQNDMIFSIICEELGLFGAIGVILLFIVLIWCCMVIANNTLDRFGSLLVVGVMSHYAIQVLLNIAVVTSIIPNTGVTLPFISYGGSAVLFLLIEIGIVLNVSQRAKVVM